MICTQLSTFSLVIRTHSASHSDAHARTMSFRSGYFAQTCTVSNVPLIRKNRIAPQRQTADPPGSHQCLELTTIPGQILAESSERPKTPSQCSFQHLPALFLLAFRLVPGLPAAFHVAQRPHTVCLPALQDAVNIAPLPHTVLGGFVNGLANQLG